MTLNFQWDDEHDVDDDGDDLSAGDQGAGPHEVITMLAENERGYANLANLISFAHITANERTRAGAETRDTCKHRTDGIIALVASPESRTAQRLMQGHYDEANQSLRRFASCFNKGLRLRRVYSGTTSTATCCETGGCTMPRRLLVCLPSQLAAWCTTTGRVAGCTMC